MYLDVVVGIIIVISIIFGLKNGFVVEFISTFGVIINFVITQNKEVIFMYLDVVVGIIIVISIIFGLKNGFVVEFISTFGVIINFVITQKVTPMVLKYVEKYFGSNYTYTYVL